MQQEGAVEDKQGEEEEEEEEEGEEKEEREDGASDDEIDSRLHDGTLLPPSALDTIGRGHGRQSRKSARDSTKPSKVAAADDDRQGLKERIAAERARKSAKEAKHHGKKAHSGKAGRAWSAGAGGKAKTSEKALVFNSLHF